MLGVKLRTKCSDADATTVLTVIEVASLTYEIWVAAFLDHLINRDGTVYGS